MELIKICKVEVEESGKVSTKVLWRDDDNLEFFIGNNPDKLRRITDFAAERYVTEAMRQIFKTDRIGRKGMLKFLTQNKMKERY